MCCPCLIASHFLPHLLVAWMSEAGVYCLQAQAKAAAEAEARKRVEEEARRAALSAPLPPGGIKRVSGAPRADPWLSSSPFADGTLSNSVGQPAPCNAAGPDRPLHQLVRGSAGGCWPPRQCSLWQPGRCLHRPGCRPSSQCRRCTSRQAGGCPGRGVWPVRHANASETPCSSPCYHLAVMSVV